MRKKFIFLLTLVIALLLVAACAEYLVPYDPYAQDLSQALKAPSSAQRYDVKGDRWFPYDDLFGITSCCYHNCYRYHCGNFLRLSWWSRGFMSYENIGYFPCISGYGFCNSSCGNFGWRSEQCGLCVGMYFMAKVCKGCPKSGDGAQGFLFYSGSETLRLRNRENDHEAYIA